MMTATLRSILLALIAVFCSAASGHAASIRAQAVCPSPNQYCVLIPTGAALPITVRSFTFTAPAGSVGLIAFSGSMFCSEVSSAQVAVNLTTQILAEPAAVPDYNRPGGLRHSATFAALGTTATFNLASSRAISYPNGGQHTVYLRLGGTALPQFTTCQIYNAAFTVTFFP